MLDPDVEYEQPKEAAVKKMALIATFGEHPGNILQICSADSGPSLWREVLKSYKLSGQ